MDKAAKLELMNAALERAAEALGDITAPVMARYYARFPDAEPAFDRLAIGDKPKLEGGMVENTLYCLMTWLESHAEVEILLWHTVPHHVQTLDVPVALFVGLAEVVTEVIVATIPADCPDELAVWEEIHAGVTRVTMQAGVDEKRIAA